MPAASGGLFAALRRIALAFIVAAVAAAAGYHLYSRDKKRKLLTPQGSSTSPSTTNENAEFNAAIATVSSGKLQLSNEQRLQLYGLFKQARFGPCADSEPSMLDMVAHAKWAAWKGVGTTSSADAMGEYVAFVARLGPKGSGSTEGSAAPSGGGGTGMRSVSTMQDPSDDAAQQAWNNEEKLFELASEGDVEKLSELLASGAGKNINKQDDMKQTPLHMASDRGHLEAVKVLMAHGANLDVQDEDGLSPLHTAVMCEHEDIVRVLVEGGADLDLLDVDGSSPAALADPGPIKELLEAAAAERSSSSGS
eukprot:g1197.t1